MAEKGIPGASSPEVESIQIDQQEIQPATDKADEALEWLKQHATEGHFAHDARRMRRLRRKIDIRVIPFLTLAYLMNFLDKILLNYANVMGIADTLGLEGNQFTNAASAFWIAVLLFEFPNVYIVQRLPVGKWLSVTLIGWGISTACTAAVTNYGGLVACRVFAGIFEAGVIPCLMLISGQWYTKQEQIVRFVWWYMGTASGFLVGGFVSWCFQHVSPTAMPLNGWQIMFLVLGLVTICLAIAIWFLVPDTPMQARFITDQEKISILEHVKGNQTGIENKRHFSWAQVKEAFLDFQLWCHWLIMLLNGGGGGVITTYSSFLIVSFGYGPKEATLLNMGSSAVAITVCLLACYGIRFFGQRWLFLISVTALAILGSAMLAYLPPTQKSGLLAGIYLAVSCFSDVPIQFGWVSSNVAGVTKRAVATSMLNAGFAIGNIIGPQTFQARDAPGYYPAKTAEMCFQACIAGLSVTLYIYYRLVNRKRDKISTAAGEDVAESKAFAGLTDKENLEFRYVY